MQETLYLITLKTIKHMKISTKAASFLSSIKTQTYDKKEREMIITYQQKRVFHLSLLMLVLCAPIYIYSVPFPNEQFYYINSVLFLFIIMCTLAYFRFSSVRLNRLRNKLLANYLKSGGNELATVRISAFCVAMLSNNSFICKYSIFFRKYELSAAVL